MNSLHHTFLLWNPWSWHSCRFHSTQTLSHKQLWWRSLPFMALAHPDDTVSPSMRAKLLTCPQNSPDPDMTEHPLNVYEKLGSMMSHCVTNLAFTCQDSAGCSVLWVLWVKSWGPIDLNFKAHGCSINFGSEEFWGHINTLKSLSHSFCSSWAVFVMSQYALSCSGTDDHQGLEVSWGYTLFSRAFAADGFCIFIHDQC